MGEDVVIVQWQRRASALISQTNVHHGALLNALPKLLIVGNDYRGALRQYMLINAKEDERELLAELSRRAEQRCRIIWKRAIITVRQNETEAELAGINFFTGMAQIAIAAGKLAEMALSVFPWAKGLKEAVATGKHIIDGVKAGGATADALMRESGGANTDYHAVMQIASFLYRLNKDLDDLAKLVWNIDTAIRRSETLGDVWKVRAEVAHAFKTAFDSLKALYAFQKTSRVEFLGAAAAFFTVVRDGIDAGMAIERAVNAFQQSYASVEAMGRHAAEGKRYLGVERHILADLRFRPTGAWTPDSIDNVMGETHDFGTASALIADAKRESVRLSTNIGAAIVFHQRQTKRLNQALAPIRPHLKETQDCLDRLGVQINALSWDADRDPRRAPALRKIAEQLTAYRAMVNGTYQQVQSLPTPGA